jgi:hypothetical protein
MGVVRHVWDATDLVGQDGMMVKPSDLLYFHNWPLP